MSGLYTVKHAHNCLKDRFERSKLPKDTSVYFVISYPRSDMGKGTLVAHLLNYLPDSNAMKFDGLLNTNANGRHTANSHDDFGVYEKFNPGKTWSETEYILGGQLISDFIREYGEYENLTFKPYLSLYLACIFQETWAVIGKPKNLIIELGGVLSDNEVGTYADLTISYFKEEYSKHIKVILLTESGFNNEYLKTKTIQDGVVILKQKGLIPDIIIAREPSDLVDSSLSNRLEYERTIIRKLSENLNIPLKTVVSMPFFKQIDNTGYGQFAQRFIAPFINYKPASTQKPKILIGSTNKSKVQEWTMYLSDKFEIVSPEDLKINLSIPEGFDSVEENAISKARAWSRVSGLPTIADDTGFFINALQGQPGVAVRRWGGEYPASTTQAEFWEILKAKVKDLKDTSAYIKTCVTLAMPNGQINSVEHITNGYIDTNLLQNQKYDGSGYPIGLVFKKIGRDKVWAELSDTEKKASDKEMMDLVVDMISQSFRFLSTP